MNRKTSALAGFVAGLVVAAAAMWLLMPRLMLVTHVSRYATIDETTAALKEAIEANSWRCPMIRNMNASMAQDGVTLESPVRIVELCNARHAREVLTTNPEISTMMPCAWGVYQRDGKVLITGMNMGLMGKMFGGNIAHVIGGSVAKDEAAILAQVVRN